MVKLLREIRVHKGVLTAGVVAGRQEDTSRGLSLSDDMASCRRGENAVLADQELLDSVGSTNLGNDLDDLWVPEAAITTNNKERVLELASAILVQTAATRVIRVYL